jgi:colanic acid biosynthesis glycosyl transferase WcaI
LHVQDFEVDAAFDLGILRSAWLRRLVLAAERWLMQRFDRVSTISNRMIERLQDKGVQQNRRVLFPNWVDLDHVFPLPAEPSLRGEWGVSDSEIVVLYSGNMGEKQGLEILIDAASRLKDSKTIRFILCGEGAARHRLEKYAHGLPNILFKPLQPLERLNDLLNLADIHALPQRADAEDLVLPSKVTNMLASGRPIIATARQETQIAQVVDNHGLVVSPGNVDEFVAAIIKLSGDRVLRQKLGKAGHQFAVTNWGKNEILGHIFSF